MKVIAKSKGPYLYRLSNGEYVEENGSLVSCSAELKFYEERGCLEILREVPDTVTRADFEKNGLEFYMKDEEEKEAEAEEEKEAEAEEEKEAEEEPKRKITVRKKKG